MRALAFLIAFAQIAAAAPAPTAEAGLGDWWNGFKDAVKDTFWPSDIKGNIDPALLAESKYYAEYAAAAYCDPEHVPGQEVTCVKGMCPDVTSSTVTTVIEFADGEADTTGIVAVDDTKKKIVIAFRGSFSIPNWIRNINILMKDVPQWCQKCSVHTGFYESYQERRELIVKTIDSLQAKHPGYEIVTVGHSLGGALAAIAATDLRIAGKKVTSYTFGSPRWGNREMSEFASAAGTNVRFTHLDDPVPRLPPIVMGYTHTSPEYHISRKSDDVQPQDVNMLEGVINFGGNTADNGLFSMNIPAHLNGYLMPGSKDIASCGSPEFPKEK